MTRKRILKISFPMLSGGRLPASIARRYSYVTPVFITRAEGRSPSSSLRVLRAAPKGTEPMLHQRLYVSSKGRSSALSLVMFEPDSWVIPEPPLLLVSKSRSNPGRSLSPLATPMAKNLAMYERIHSHSISTLSQILHQGARKDIHLKRPMNPPNSRSMEEAKHMNGTIYSGYSIIYTQHIVLSSLKTIGARRSANCSRRSGTHQAVLENRVKFRRLSSPSASDCSLHAGAAYCWMDTV